MEWEGVNGLKSLGTPVIEGYKEAIIEKIGTDERKESQLCIEQENYTEGFVWGNVK